MMACDLPVSSLQQRQTCPGQVNLAFTTDYVGPQEHVVDGADPGRVGHGAAAEVLSWDRLALAWIRSGISSYYVAAKRYDSATKSFIGNEIAFSPWPASSWAWIQRLGYDDACTVIPGESSCAWFAFEDSEAYVEYRAIGANGGLSWSYPAYFPGRAPSGDKGAVGATRRLLLAYITPDRRAVRARLLDANGGYLGETVLQSFAVGNVWRAYQTQVAWSSVDQQWLVAWTEAVPAGSTRPARVKTRSVGFGGTAGTTINDIMACDIAPECGGTSSYMAASREKAGIIGPDANQRCVCYGLWLAASTYGTATDRYRIHQYTKHARINAGGGVAGIFEADLCTVYCPVTEALFGLAPDYSPFQLLRKAGYPPNEYTEHCRLTVDSDFYTNAGLALAAPYGYPQALRSNGYRAVAVSSTNSALRLSIVDSLLFGCPP